MKLQLVALAATIGGAQAFCPNYCSGHGECTENDICECFAGFGEPDCSVRMCPSGLSWVVGTSSELDMYPTPNGPVGKHPYTECSSRGTCDRATGECECFDGYTGKACRRSMCPNECSGHGLCVADGDVKSVLDGASYYGGANDFLLAPAKQYWNAKMSHQCICDQQYTGYDCSTRICPLGLDPTTSCDDTAEVNDVQAVSVKFGQAAVGGVTYDDDTDGYNDHTVTYAAHNIEQFLTLTFTSQFNAQYETSPISYWDTASTVQQALISLPNFAIGDVQVYKMFPLDDPTTPVCPAAYFNEYQSTLCGSTADCQARFPSLGANVICDSDILACVETDTTDCVYQDGATEFAVGTDCAIGFEIDGLYRDIEGAATDFYWGHRLTAFERNCQAGKFSPDDTKYTVACAADTDCVPCAGWTGVTNGLCLASGVCGAQELTAAAGIAGAIAGENTITDLLAVASAAAGGHPAIGADELDCGVATFLIKFSDSSTPGAQNDLVCNIDNTDADQAGASPMYQSTGLDACSVTHVGVPEFTDGEIVDDGAGSDTAIDNELDFCIAVDENDLTTSMVAAADCTTGGVENVAMTLDDINTAVGLQSGNVVSEEGGERPTSPSFVITGTEAVYTEEEIDAKLSSAFSTPMPCSNQGACDYSTGMCECADGYAGAACDSVVSYV